MLAAAVAAIAGVASGCSAQPVTPRPTPTYSVSPVVTPANLDLMGDGATFCESHRGARSAVFGVGIRNDDATAVTLISVHFDSTMNGTVTESWTVAPTKALSTAGQLETAVFDYPPKVSDWSTRADVNGTTIAPGASTYILMRLVKDAGATEASFVNAGVTYTKSGHAFVANGTSSGFEFRPGGHCTFPEN